jgi:MFS transporter, ACS family, D-galactonate transporter
LNLSGGAELPNNPNLNMNSSPKVSTNKPTRVRFMILFLLFMGTVINYLDRTNISVAAPSIKQALHLDPVKLGFIFSSFGWTYALMQIPGGWFLDRFGSRIAFGFSLVFWSLATFFQAFAKGFGILFGLRLGLGFFEAPSFPTNNRVVTAWFPAKERGFATSVYTAGEFVGLAFLTPILFWMLSTYGWPSIFIATGIIGLIWSLIWFKFYRDPNESKYINEAEMNYIREGGGLADSMGEKEKLSWAKVSHLFKHRQLIGIYIGQFAIVSTLFFFLTWFPTYLVTAKHMTILKVGFYASVPYIAAFIGVLCGGGLSDWMLRRGFSTGTARKIPIIAGLLLSSCMVFANYTSSVGLVISIMSIAFFGQGLSGISWTLVSDISPRELVGLAGGVFNFMGNLAGIVIPLVIGFIVNDTHSFNGALFFETCVALVGALSYIFVVGKVKRIEIES